MDDEQFQDLFNFDISDDSDSTDPEEKGERDKDELVKWRRRWALEDIKAKTDSSQPGHQYYKELYDKLEKLHMITDPETKNYMKEKEMKSQQAKEPAKDETVQPKADQVSLQKDSFPLDKVFKNVGKLRKSLPGLKLNESAELSLVTLKQRIEEEGSAPTLLPDLAKLKKHAENSSDDIKFEPEKQFSPALKTLLKKADDNIKKGNELFEKFFEEHYKDKEDAKSKIFEQEEFAVGKVFEEITKRAKQFQNGLKEENWQPSATKF